LVRVNSFIKKSIPVSAARSFLSFFFEKKPAALSYFFFSDPRIVYG